MHEVQSFDDAVRDFRMDGRVVVVTGGAGLLGAEYTAALSAAGAHVVVADVDAEAAERVAAAAPGARAVPVRVDVADADSVSRLLHETLARFGRVDGLVNNAALDPKFDAVRAGEHELGFEAFPVDEWNGALAVNLTGSTAVAMGACYVERHITLDRAMWGSDQAASIEPQGFARLAHYVRSVESALGDGIKQVYASEIPVMQRLRRVK